MSFVFLLLPEAFPPTFGFARLVVAGNVEAVVSLSARYEQKRVVKDDVQTELTDAHQNLVLNLCVCFHAVHRALSLRGFLV